MRKFFLSAILLALPWNIAYGQVPYLEEVKALGIISGQGMACGSSKHPTFEMLARAIMLTKAPSQQMLTEAAYIYSEEKANTYLSKQMDGHYQCNAIVRRFDNQDIFKINLYADGTLKMPDGQIITPRQPYDASSLYKADKQIEIKAKAIYEGAPARVPEGMPAPVISSAKPDKSGFSGFNTPAMSNASGADNYAPSMIKHISRNNH